MQEGFVTLPVVGREVNGKLKGTHMFWCAININNVVYVTKSDSFPNSVNLHLNNGEVLIVERTYAQIVFDVTKLFEK